VFYINEHYGGDLSRLKQYLNVVGYSRT